MKGSLIVVGFFALGCLLGWSGLLPDMVVENDITVYVLYLLMFQVGLSIGSDKKLKEILGSIRPKLLLVPLSTIVGTLVFSALVSLLLSRWSLFDCLAVGSGFAYYSLSSILITQLKEPSLGVQLATELGTIALMANIMREIMALLGAPLFVKYFGRLAPICAGGATTMDTTLPIITRYSGKDLVFVSIFHGIIVDFTVPFFVSFFCSM
ncbi:lysine exporter LysO family protein [uncultured Parabacteroides sp.]|uniref:lysine exporter LysO family protein n=1 Tax=uncultured Parabacteroides sp. TaxID=512312 RepID=UPI0025EDA2A9|nr:lysine exporter LysO family protein [uncultured Parabacteroides sp.]